MKIALATLAYRQTMSAQTGYAWVQDALAARDLGWQPIPLWIDCSGIARARNRAIEMSTQAGARLCLMADNDSFPDTPDGGLASMWQAMQDTGAAAVGAAVVVRNRERVNCEPSRPGEVYVGEKVGTAYMLLDLWRLRDVPRPWFRHADTDGGLDVQCGEDVYMCRLFQQYQHKVAINYALPTGHADQHVARTFE